MTSRDFDHHHVTCMTAVITVQQREVTAVWSLTDYSNEINNDVITPTGSCKMNVILCLKKYYSRAMYIFKVK